MKARSRSTLQKLSSIAGICFLVVFAFSLTTSMMACEKEPEIIIQKDTISIIDTIVVVDTFTIIETIFENLPDTATTFILVRHAETTGAGNNPNLSAAGQTRADELSRIVSNLDLNAVYSTNFNRTMQTAQPVASAQGLSIVQYDPFMPAALIQQALDAFPKGVVLVVGHSNTTAAMLNEMVGANTYPDIAESEYDNMFIVHVSDIGKATVTHLKYGM